MDHDIMEPTEHEQSPRSDMRATRDLHGLLRQADLRPTKQRLTLGALLFAGADRHVTAELLHAEAVALGECVSLATVYNTLHQFQSAGLLREIAIDGAKTYFDTNTSNHHHFFIESQDQLVDIPEGSIQVSGVPQPPAGMKITHVDVVIRLAELKDMPSLPAAKSD